MHTYQSKYLGHNRKTDMEKISYQKYVAIALDMDTAEEELLRYSIVVKGKNAFEFELKPNPSLVEISPELVELENAMKIGNAFSRARRHNRFYKELKKEDHAPVVVTEGDSWFQFPFLIDEVVDNLKHDYLIYSVGAAGDTASNMVGSKVAKGNTEYMLALRKQRQQVKAFMFSGAGNDIIGENPATGVAALQDIIKDFNGNDQDILGHINLATLSEKLGMLSEYYRTVFDTIRRTAEFSKLPIFIHGYDYVFPYPSGENDPRNPSYAKNNEWLGKPLDSRGIVDQALRRDILKSLIDSLYDMFFSLLSNYADPNIHIVDCRGAMPDVSDWNDEIHGTSDGFRKVAERFRQKLDSVLKLDVRE